MHAQVVGVCYDLIWILILSVTTTHDILLLMVWE